MALAWQNNPRGICEDAPCCGCCGPQGDGQISDEPYDPDDFLPDDEQPWLGEDEEDGEDVYEEPSPDPYWYMD